MKLLLFAAFLLPGLFITGLAQSIELEHDSVKTCDDHKTFDVICETHITNNSSDKITYTHPNNVSLELSPEHAGINYKDRFSIDTNNKSSINFDGGSVSHSPSLP